jgi:hypothetical protein
MAARKSETLTKPRGYGTSWVHRSPCFRHRDRGYLGIGKWSNVTRSPCICFRTATDADALVSCVGPTSHEQPKAAVGRRVIDSLPDPPVAEDLSEPNYRRIVTESIGGIFTDAGSFVREPDAGDLHVRFMVEPVRHRQTKEAATDMFDLTPPRHISTLPKRELPSCDLMSASASTIEHAKSGLRTPLRPAGQTRLNPPFLFGPLGRNGLAFHATPTFATPKGSGGGPLRSFPASRLVRGPPARIPLYFSAFELTTIYGAGTRGPKRACIASLPRSRSAALRTADGPVRISASAMLCCWTNLTRGLRRLT